MTYPLRYVPIDEATTPKDGECLVGRWWIYKSDEGIALAQITKHYYAPQCNHNQLVIRTLMEALYPDHELIEIPVVYLGWLSPPRE